MKAPQFFAILTCAALLLRCGDDAVHNPDYGAPPDAGYDPGNGGGNGPYGSGGNNGGGDGGAAYDAGPPICDDSLKRCAEEFTYPFSGETSVELRGDYRSDAWIKGDAMTHSGASWKVTVKVPYGKSVQYKFFVDGTTWKVDSAQPTVTDSTGNTNNIKQAITCTDYTCDQPALPPPGVFDWRDAVIYFAFVDRFADGNASNNCNVSGAQATSTSSTNYLGGDWAGITQKINSGYFTDLGANVLWINVPFKDVDNEADPGTTCSNGSCSNDGHMYSAYHGYWPSDPSSTESCFGSAADLTALVAAAHAKNIKVLFDYAMVHAHTSGAVYQAHKNDTPSWFTPLCQCGDTNHGCGNYDNYTCWFTSYLAHFDFTNSSAARTYSVNAAVNLVSTYGNDAYRLDAIKQVDPSWLAALRPQIASQVLAKETPQQRFYMVGETYDFQNRGLIRSFLDSTNKLDGQFDFPLRIRLVEAVLMRSTQNLLTPDDLGWSRNAPPGLQGLAQFLDSNDTFYPVDSVMSTFVGNQDLPRSIHYAEDTPLFSSSADDGKGLAWSNQPGASTNSRAYERLANAFAVLMTTKGAPLIYYGDEIGLPGAGDPDNRRMMQWTGYTTDQQSLYARIKTLTTIRAAHPALRRGTRTTKNASADLWVFEAYAPAVGTIPADDVYVAINRSDTDATASGLPAATLKELVTGAVVVGPSGDVPARQTRIFVQP
jgi:glycosidase